MGLALRLTFHRAAEILGITTDDVRSLVVEMPRRLPAIYVTQVGHAEPYEWQLLRVDSAGNAFDMSVGGIDGAVHTGFLRIERAALEKFIRDNDLPARHETEFAPHPATEPGAPVPKPQAAAPAPLVAEGASNAPAWTVRKPKRYRGYAAPLHRLLVAAQRDGNLCPTARDVVEAWRNNAPAEIAKVLPDGFDYYDANGNTKTAGIDAIRNAIKRMTSAR